MTWVDLTWLDSTAIKSHWQQQTAAVLNCYYLPGSSSSSPWGFWWPTIYGSYLKWDGRDIIFIVVVRLIMFNAITTTSTFLLLFIGLLQNYTILPFVFSSVSKEIQQCYYNHESSQYVLSNIVFMLLILLIGFFFVVAVVVFLWLFY